MIVVGGGAMGSAAALAVGEEVSGPLGIPTISPSATAPSLRLAADLMAWCARDVPKFNAISISGYHIRDAGSTAAQVDYDFSDWSPYNASGGDLDGVGHFRAKNNTGAIQARMLSTTCSGSGCCTGYSGSCVP